MHLKLGQFRLFLRLPSQPFFMSRSLYRGLLSHQSQMQSSLILDICLKPIQQYRRKHASVSKVCVIVQSFKGLQWEKKIDYRFRMRFQADLVGERRKNTCDTKVTFIKKKKTEYNHVFLLGISYQLLAFCITALSLSFEILLHYM